MGDVAVALKIMPESPETDLESIKKSLKDILGDKVKQIEEKPLAFGLKAVNVLFVVSDKGGIEDIEKKIKDIKGVANVETGDITLL